MIMWPFDGDRQLIKHIGGVIPVRPINTPYGYKQTSLADPEITDFSFVFRVAVEFAPSHVFNDNNCDIIFHPAHGTWNKIGDTLLEGRLLRFYVDEERFYTIGGRCNLSPGDLRTLVNYLDC